MQPTARTHLQGAIGIDGGNHHGEFVHVTGKRDAPQIGILPGNFHPNIALLVLFGRMPQIGNAVHNNPGHKFFATRWRRNAQKV